MQRVAINGFGRIGRNVLRAWFETPRQQLQQQIIAINDIADIETLAHLLRFDTTHGRFAGTVEILQQDSQHGQENFLVVNALGSQLKIQVFQQARPQDLPWQQLDIDVALECSGFFRSREAASQHLVAGAKRVIIGAAPFDSVDAAIVYGVNHQDLKLTDQVISSVSCTTQALVPMVKILDDAFGIESAMMTEIHAVTTDQAVLDHVHRDLRRARASGHNIIPTTSSALGALKRVMPHMQDRIEGYSIRVPTLNVAAIDLTIVMPKAHHIAEINQSFAEAIRGQYANIMAMTDQPLVSSDFNHSPYSLIVDSLQTMTAGRQAKVFAWYDNEWGYANRLLDLVGCLNRL
ncbi:type I glyceraldehyde-3-phosphate dehydrogenase [Acinetobacter populi]|uniref:Erythrose-4-phosphate dehydrogenase n=1 Tax=Acinetobacter populi TaxID=1582270 RepID=A0A1Z9YZD3_9GAMM|nr:type I glyceraldehyde-3-phosphate dehydrogenase [Acinetobacter populi]OUY07575.1 erythrose-4-phosphate dehydrogenase [Acinetobacter populi]